MYAAFHDWLGRGDALRPMWEAWKAGDRKRALEVVPDEVIDEVFLHGTPEECWAGVHTSVRPRNSRVSHQSSSTTFVMPTLASHALIPSGTKNVGWYAAFRRRTVASSRWS